MNNWIEILKAYHEGKFDRYYFGLTPRLIVGGCQIPIGVKFENKVKAYNITKKIVEEMQQYYKDGLIVSSNYCDIHKGPVLQLKEAEWSENSFGTNLEIIWNRYGDEIINGDFGINCYDKTILNSIFKEL